MESGKLKQKIIIQKKGSTKNAYGEVENVWTTHTTTWASIMPISGREYFSAKQINAEVNTKIIIRYNPNAMITPKMIIKFGSRTYKIIDAIIPEEAKRQVHLMCSEVI